MSRFIVPKGLEFTFRIQIMEVDSFLPQNLAGFDDTASTLQFLNKSDNEVIDGTVVPMAEMLVTKVSDSISSSPVAEVSELTVYKVVAAVYTISLNDANYEVSNLEDEYATTAEIAQAFYVQMDAATPDGLVPSISNDVITITNSEGTVTDIDLSDEIIKTDYTAGVPDVDTDWYDTNGYVTATVIATDTDKLDVDKGDRVDGYYLKSKYSAILNLVFSDTANNRVARIQDVYVTHAGA